jgi:hypothetical protein
MNVGETSSRCASTDDLYESLLPSTQPCRLDTEHVILNGADSHEQELISSQTKWSFWPYPGCWLSFKSVLTNIIKWRSKCMQKFIIPISNITIIHKTKSLKQLIYVNFQKLQSLNSPYVILRPRIKFSHEATSSIHLLF